MKVKLIGMLVAIAITLSALLSLYETRGAILESGVPVQSTSNWNPVSEGLQLTAKLKREEISAGKSVILEITLRNMTKQAVMLAETYPESSYKIDVTDDNGESLPLTKYGNWLKQNEGNAISRRLVRVNPSEEITNSILINRIYDMTASGTYFVTARRIVLRAEGKGSTEIVSNTVSVKIVD